MNKSTANNFYPKYANDLWVFDIMAGPYLSDPNIPEEKIQSYLLTWLDVKTKNIPYARFFTNSSQQNLKLTLKSAIKYCGLPKIIYSHHEKFFSNDHFVSVCARLSIQLITPIPQLTPLSKKAEKFFHYVRSSFLQKFANTNLLTLKQLNHNFQYWLFCDYFEGILSSQNKSAIDIFFDNFNMIEFIPDDLLADAFL